MISPRVKFLPYSQSSSNFYDYGTPFSRHTYYLMEVVSKEHILGNTMLDSDVHNKVLSDLNLLSPESLLMELITN